MNTVLTKTEFLAELRRKLKGLPIAEIDAALAYWDEYLSDAGTENEAATLAQIGSPGEVAASIFSDYALRDTSDKPASAKRGLTTMWLVVLGVFASPIALPLALALVAVLFSLLVVVLICLVSFFVTAFALFLSGVVGIAFGIYLLFVHFASGLWTLGLGLVLTAIGAALSLVLIWLSKVTINGIARLGARLLQKRKGATHETSH